MPVTRSKQVWEVGRMVNVGFLTLLITGFEPTPGDHKPDVYLLQSARGTKYRFTPHHGLEKVEDQAA